MIAQLPRIRFPLFWQVYLNGILLLVALAIGGVVMDSFASVERWEALHIRLAAHLAAQVEPLRDDPAALQGFLDRSGDLELRLTAYSMNGDLIASNIRPPLPPLTEEERAILEGGPFCNTPRMWHVAAKIGDGRGGAGYLLLEDRAFPSRSAGSLASYLLCILITLALASIPLTWAITAPMRRLAATATALGKGDLRVRSGIRRPDEVGTLAASLDEMADRLETMVKREKQILADIGHELRTPLARIRVAADIAREGDLERAHRYLAEIGVDLDELDRLIEDVLQASRLELAAGRFDGDGLPPLRKERIDVQSILASAADRSRSRHPDRTLRVESRANGARLDADPALLRRALDNLLDNAFKYSQAPQEVRLEAREENGGLVLAVSDSGIGIDADDLPRLFTPFFRTDRSRARSSGGVGLGLVLARRIVEAHGGKIAVTSHPGEGTTVGISLPVALP